MLTRAVFTLLLPVLLEHVPLKPAGVHLLAALLANPHVGVRPVRLRVVVQALIGGEVLATVGALEGVGLAVDTTGVSE